MIDLAHCADFEIGIVAVRTSSRELSTSTGCVTVEPKVMQVLVALARTGGRVVSRDDLVAQCWSGRIVGDDAINRIIGKLRRAAAAAGSDAFEIQTVARMGYRLVTGGPVVVPPSGPPPSLHAPTGSPIAAVGHRALRAAAAAAAVAAVIFGATVAIRPSRRAVPHPVGTTAIVTPTMPAAVDDLETRGLSAMFDDTPERSAASIDYLRQATALAPRSAPLWGSLAMSYVLSLGWTPPTERAAIGTRVRDAAMHGLFLAPRESRSEAALVSLKPTFGNWAGKAKALRTTTARASPDSGPLAYQNIQFLLAVGRDQAALAEILRIAPRSRLVPWIRAAQIDLLAAAGRLDEADRLAGEMSAIWPHDRLIWFTRFDFAMFNGQPARARAMAGDRSSWPNSTSAEEIALAAKTAGAIASRDPRTTDEALDALQAAVNGHGSAERAIRAAVALGHPEVALRVARRLYWGHLSAQPRATLLPLIGMPDNNEPPTAALFLPPMSALWRDPKFIAMLTDMGLVDYWRASETPDFCLKAEASVRCRKLGIGLGSADVR